MCLPVSEGRCVCRCLRAAVRVCARAPARASSPGPSAAEAQPPQRGSVAECTAVWAEAPGQATGVWRALGHCAGLGAGLGPELLAAARGSTKAIISLPRQLHFPRELLTHRRQQTPPRMPSLARPPGQRCVMTASERGPGPRWPQPHCTRMHGRHGEGSTGVSAAGQPTSAPAASHPEAPRTYPHTAYRREASAPSPLHSPWEPATLLSGPRARLLPCDCRPVPRLSSHRSLQVLPLPSHPVMVPPKRGPRLAESAPREEAARPLYAHIQGCPLPRPGFEARLCPARFSRSLRCAVLSAPGTPVLRLHRSVQHGTWRDSLPCRHLHQ